MQIELLPAKLSGVVQIPPSKSDAHRAIICAALSQGTSTIANVAFSDDIIATIGAMRTLGATINQVENKLIVQGISQKVKGDIEINCIESGSTLRFLTMIASALCNGKIHFVGKGKLGTRPMEIFQNILQSQGILYQNDSLQNANQLLDLWIGGGLSSGKFSLRGDVSSQFLSGLLFACPLLAGDSEIEITSPMQSVGYVDLTLNTLSKFGIVVDNDHYQRFFIRGNQRYQSRDYTIEGDYSQAAFFKVANLIGNDIEICGLSDQSFQGDKVIDDFCDQIARAESEQTLVLDCGDCPDIVPPLAVGVGLRKGKTRIVNIGRLKIKECDRLAATYSELSKLGANIKMGQDYLEFDGVQSFSGGQVSSFNDHRMAMALAIAATRATSPVIIDSKECVSKSYPDFWQVYTSVGGKIK
mgnify:CR=1 FL=1